MWNDIDVLSKIARFLPYVMIGLGFFVAISGQLIKGLVDGRVSELNSTAELERQNTRPLIDVQLARGETTGRLIIVIDAKNEIPFRADWLVVTTNDRLVSPLMMGKDEFFPTRKNQRFKFYVTLNNEKIVEDYIELRFRYESSFFRELGKPPHLKGEIVKRYRFLNSRIYPIE